MAITIDQQIRCLAQEIDRRKSAYPVLIKQGRFTEEKATYEIEVMRKALQTLTQLKGIVAS